MRVLSRSALVMLALPALMSTEAAACSVQSRPFGTLASGTPVRAYLIANDRIDVTILDYGGIIHEIRTPDRIGNRANVVRNLEALSDYERNASFSRIIGRYAGRIDQSGFTLDGRRYELAARPDGITSHGGPGGFGSRMWTARTAVCGLDLSLESPDGENGFPGNLRVDATFRLDGADLHIDYRAATDKATVVNLTHHAFFNLSGAPDVYGQQLQIHAGRWLPTDARRVPTGDIAPVRGVLDLRDGRKVGAVANADDPAIKASNGLDHTFVLDDRQAATLSDAASGRVLTVFTSEPGIVVFSANGWNGTLRDTDGRPLLKGGGLALETQHFPNSPNIPAFPTTVLRPGAPLHTTTIFRFGIDTRPDGPQGP